jgi:rifamycin polyketide synthase module 1/2/3
MVTMRIRGGQNIAPVELEECIQSYPDVLDCAVAGVPHAFPDPVI